MIKSLKTESATNEKQKLDDFMDTGLEIVKYNT